MIKSLRIKFIIISMISILIAFVIVMASINIANFVTVSNNADSDLKTIFNAGGKIDDGINWDDNVPPDGEPMESSDTSTDDSTTYTNTNARSYQNTDKNGNQTNEFDNKNLEWAFQIRYFTITIKNGTTYEVYLDKIKEVSTEDMAIEYAKKAMNKDSKKGYIGNYRYLYGSVDETTEMVIFVDCTKELKNAQSFLLSSSIISLIAYACVFVAIFFASKLIFKQVDEAYQKQKRFISNASHELKTPLTIISANNEIVEMTYGDNESTDAIGRQVVRLNHMVSSLSLLTKLSEKKKIENPQDINITEALNDVIADSYILNDDKKKCDVKIEPDLKYIGNEGLIRQLFSIIIDNAIKYSNTYVYIHGYKENKNVVLEFINDCYQIDDGAHPEVFERFYRSDNIRSKMEGSGIGLSIAKEIADLHKANITASSVNNSFKIKIIL